MRPPTAFLTRPWGLVAVTGDDATSFLQALVSQDLEGLTPGASAPCLLLHPQGKVDVSFRVLRVEEGWWCSTEPTAAARLAASLQRFRIRVRAEIDDRTAGAARAELVAADGPVDARADLVPDGLAVATVERPGWSGTEVVGPAEAVAAWVSTTGVPPGAPEERERLRIRAGIARQDVDLDDSVIPQEAFLEVEAVSFTKGCFLGQELVCRIDSRGHVNRFLRVLDLTAPVAVGDEVRHDGRPVGAVTSVAPDGGGACALAFVRREVLPPAVVEVGPDGVRGAVRVGPDASSAE